MPQVRMSIRRYSPSPSDEAPVSFTRKPIVITWANTRSTWTDPSTDVGGSSIGPAVP